jgi:hypothetical protein
MLKMYIVFLSIIAVISLFVILTPVTFADSPYSAVISGQVVDRNGMPLVNATVDVRDYTGLIINTTVSSANGNFIFYNIPISGDGGDSYQLWATYNVSNNTFTDKTAYFQVYKNQVAIQNVTLYYYPPSSYGWITGRVVNLSNINQYLSATIFLNNGMYTFVSSDPSDHFQFYLPIGTYSLYAEHDENGNTYMSGTTTVQVSSDNVNTVIIPLSLANSTPVYYPPPPVGDNIVTGTVLQNNNQPLYGATMDLCLITGQSFEPVMTTTTNITGSYVFDNVTVDSVMDSYVVRLTYSYNGLNYVQVSNPPITIYNNNMLNVTHTLNVPMSVPFVDSGNLQFITSPEGAEVWINGEDSGEQTPFNFTGLKTGNYTCSLQLDGYLPINMTVGVSSENTTIINKVLMPSTGSVSFNITPSDASIYLNGQLIGTGTTNISKLENGHYTYVVSRDGYQNVTGAFDVSPGGVIPINVSMVAVPGLSLTYFSYIINQILSSLGNIL